MIDMPEISGFRPETDEYAPLYKGYVALVPGDDILAVLEESKDRALVLFKSIIWEKWEVAPAPGKWSVGEVVLHMIDSERVFAYRALAIARGDKTPLPGFDQDTYVENCGAQERHPASIVDEYAAVRNATLHFLRNLSPEMWRRTGTANGDTVSVRALAWIIAGHELHHLQKMRDLYL
jgi:hypothetical protein